MSDESLKYHINQILDKLRTQQVNKLLDDPLYNTAMIDQSLMDNGYPDYQYEAIERMLVEIKQDRYLIKNPPPPPTMYDEPIGQLVVKEEGKPCQKHCWATSMKVECAEIKGRHAPVPRPRYQMAKRCITCRRLETKTYYATEL